MMQLKLLGVLQDYGTPYTSLYVNGDDKVMYIAIEQDSTDPQCFSSLLLKVTEEMVINYMHQHIGLRRLSQLSQEKYIWKRKKGAKGTMTSLGYSDVTNRIDADDDMFDADICNNQSSILYYINQMN